MIGWRPLPNLKTSCHPRTVPLAFPSPLSLALCPFLYSGSSPTMEGVHYELNTESQFWGEIDDILSPLNNTSTETWIRNFVRFAAYFRGTNLGPWGFGDGA